MKVACRVEGNELEAVAGGSEEALSRFLRARCTLCIPRPDVCACLCPCVSATAPLDTVCECLCGRVAYRRHATTFPCCVRLLLFKRKRKISLNHPHLTLGPWKNSHPGRIRWSLENSQPIRHFRQELFYI